MGGDGGEGDRERGVGGEGDSLEAGHHIPRLRSVVGDCGFCEEVGVCDWESAWA